MPEFYRFVLNGLVATGLHFGVLSFLIEIAGVPSAALANFVAALFGISASFAGNRLFVFREATSTISSQLPRFLGLYAAIALMHAGFLFVWSDHLQMDYRIGFVIATCAQVLLSYFGNKILVFAK